MTCYLIKQEIRVYVVVHRYRENFNFTFNFYYRIKLLGYFDDKKLYLITTELCEILIIISKNSH
jgi:hypothetical protein